MFCLDKLKNLAATAADWAEGHALTLPEAALRFCLAKNALNSVLVGISSLPELHTALAIAGKGPLPADQYAETCKLAVSDQTIIDPRVWGID